METQERFIADVFQCPVCLCLAQIWVSVCMNDRLHALGRDMYTAVLPRKDYLLYLPFPVKHWVRFLVFTLHRLAPES